MLYQPLVSIITPSYNQGGYLEETIRSVLGQDYARIEYLVIDGGSTDNSVEIIQRYQDRLEYWVSEPDDGQAQAVNKGLRRAKGEILGWLNSDDLLLPDTVSRAVDTFQVYPEVDVVYGRLERIDAEGRLVPTPELPKDRLTFGKLLVVGECIVNQPGCFWRRRVMRQAGLLDESLRYSLDYEYWIRMALAGAQFTRRSEVVARFRLSSASKTTRQAAEMAQEQLAVLNGLLAMPDLAERSGLHPAMISRRARRTQAVFELQAFYGSLKRRRWNRAWGWLWQALRTDPTAIFQRRWIDLAAAGLARRL